MKLVWTHAFYARSEAFLRAGRHHCSSTSFPTTRSTPWLRSEQFRAILDVSRVRSENCRAFSRSGGFETNIFEHFSRCGGSAARISEVSRGRQLPNPPGPQRLSAELLYRFSAWAPTIRFLDQSYWGPSKMLWAGSDDTMVFVRAELLGTF